MRDDDKRNVTDEIVHSDERKFPAIALRGVVAFPNMVLHFDVAREMSMKAIDEALAGDRRIFW